MNAKCRFATAAAGLCAALAFTATPLRADVNYTWAGGVSADWCLGASWNSDTYPNSVSDYHIGVFDQTSTTEPITVTFSGDVSTYGINLKSAPATTFDLGGHTISLSGKSAYGSGGWSTPLKLTLGNSPVTFANGSFARVNSPNKNMSPSMSLPAGSDLTFDNMASVSFGQLGGKGHMTICNKSVVSGDLTVGDGYHLTVDDATISGGVLNGGASEGSPALIEVLNGGVVNLPSTGWAHKNGAYTTFKVTGENSSLYIGIIKGTARTPRGFEFTGCTWEAVDGGAIAIATGTDGFNSGSAYNNDIKNTLFANDGTISLTQMDFAFGVHTTDDTCVSPTLHIAGASGLIKTTASSITLGSEATLTNPPELIYDIPAGGFDQAALQSITKLTINDNVKITIDGTACAGIAGTKYVPLAYGKTGLTVSATALANATFANMPDGVECSFATNADDATLAANTLYLKLVSNIRAVEVPVIAGVVYDGQPHTPVVPASTNYTVTTLPTDVVNAGDYDVVLELSQKGTAWADDASTGPKTLTFTIEKAANGWTVEPALSKTAWEYGEENAEVTNGEALTGETVAPYYDGDTALVEMPEGVGGHTAHFVVEERDNYKGLDKEIAFTISKRTNYWTVEPALSKTTWSFDQNPAEVTAGEAASGEPVEVTYSPFDADASTMPTNLGNYTATFTVLENDTWKGIVKAIAFSITKKANDWVVAPSVPKTFNIEDPVPTFTPPTATYGEVVTYYDGDPAVTEMPTSLGSHTVTYVVAEGDDYQGKTETYAYAVTYKPVTDDAGRVYGYRLPKLGADTNEVAVVFTNTAFTAENPMTYKLPRMVTSVSYLVVGGGAGGSWSSAAAEGGGGAGGALTNENVEASGTIGVVVGVGGTPGMKGSDSALILGETSLVAYAGGASGQNGGCGGGGGSKHLGGGKYAGLAGGEGTEGQGYAGGYGMGTTFSSGGGGGAGTNGWDCTSTNPGHGGDGIACSITGEEVWYAGGGAGVQLSNAGCQARAYGGKGGGGNGAYCASNQSAAGGDATYFGGGGGSGKGLSGGKGYQGIVIVCYVEPAGMVMEPVIASKPYSGETQVADVPANAGYAVTQNDGGVDVGNYTVTLALNEGHVWDDGTTAPKDLAFTITQAQNFWTVKPSISKDNWLTTDEPGVLTNGVTRFGTVTRTITKAGGETQPFDGNLPTKAGAYVITNTAPETCDNYLAPTDSVKTVAFTIFGEDETPDFTVALDGAVTTGLNGGSITAAVPYRVACDVESSKRVNVHALVALEGAVETNRVTLAEDVALDAAGFGLLDRLLPGTNYWVSLCGQGGETFAPTTTPVCVTTPGQLAIGDTAHALTKTTVTLTGVVTGLGAKTVTIRYWFGSGEPTDQPVALDANGAFTLVVNRTSPTDVLGWKVIASSVLTLDYGTYEYAAETADLSVADAEEVTYTWQGGATGAWADPANWSASVTPSYGYPNSATAKAKFTTDAEVDLEGGTYKHTGYLTGAAGHYITLTGGKIDNDSSFGCDAGTLELKNIEVRATSLNGPTDTTIVLSGTNYFNGFFNAWGSKNQKLIVRDGESSFAKLRGYGSGDLLITNAVLKVRDYTATHYSNRIGDRPYRFIPGDDREARILLDSATDVNGAYEFTIPERGLADAAIQASRIGGLKATTITAHVADYPRGKKVPLMRFTEQSTLDLSYFTLKAYENGVDVTEKRNAHLEWSSEDRTLYYKQNGQLGMLMFVR